MGKLKQSFQLMKTKNDETFVFFIALLYGISTGEIGAVDLISTGRNAPYGRYSKAFDDVYKMGVGWSYGLAKSCEMISVKVSDESNDVLKLLLVKLSQVITLGDDLKTFFRDEFKNALLDYSVVYERKLESHKLFMEMFYTLMSTASFMVAANSIMGMLMGSNDSSTIMITTLVGIAGGMSGFVWMMYTLFPRDPVSIPEDDKKFRMWMYIGIGGGMGVGMGLGITGILPIGFVVAIAGVLLIYPGFMARKKENNIKELNKWYPNFILHFGQIYATVGSMGMALTAVLRSDFGPLQKHIIAMKNRTKNKVDQKISFYHFSLDASSHLIANGNAVMSAGMDKGADLNKTGNVVSDTCTKMNELLEKKWQASKTFEMIVLVLHALSLAVFGLMDKLAVLFQELISSTDVSNNAFTLTPIDPAIMAIAAPALIIFTSTISGFAIKITQGGLYKTVLYHIGLLMVVGGVSLSGTNMMLADFLESQIIDGITTPPIPGV